MITEANMCATCPHRIVDGKCTILLNGEPTGAENLHRLICEVSAQQQAFKKRLEDAVKLLDSLKAAMK